MLKQRLLMASHKSNPLGYGSMYAFGPNVNGTTGLNVVVGITSSPTAVVSPNTDWVQISTGFSPSAPSGGGSLGLLSTGALYSWGNNGNGASGTIGQGNNADPYNVPTQLGTDTDWAYIAISGYGGLLIKNNGTLWSFGLDSDGQLCTGNLGQRYVPAQVGSATDWAQASIAYQCSFMIKTTGTLWTAGANSFYRTGRGINSGNILNPTQIGSVSTWTKVSPASYGGIALRSDGSAWSWGTDITGELCQGSSGGTYTTPTQIGTDTDWYFVASNGPNPTNGLTFLIKQNGTLWVAGSNNSYASGRGINSGNTTTLTQVGTDTNWKEVYISSDGVTGVNSVVALKTNGELWSWGSNANGCTGQGTTTGNTTTPTKITGINTWIKLCQGSSGGVVLALKS